MKIKYEFGCLIVKVRRAQVKSNELTIISSGFALSDGRLGKRYSYNRRTVEASDNCVIEMIHIFRKKALAQ
ncbi:hypothetical protein [Bacteroides acidifaciens]|uniref:hypothetical protein n=1 Tax=Bacteroides acidifaciens TaxID=85831 RepID=UPI0025940CC5|nr:hypothetical protein [Bacteroides acidifaciens]